MRQQFCTKIVFCTNEVHQHPFGVIADVARTLHLLRHLPDERAEADALYFAPYANGGAVLFHQTFAASRSRVFIS